MNSTFETSLLASMVCSSHQETCIFGSPKYTLKRTLSITSIETTGSASTLVSTSSQCTLVNEVEASNFIASLDKKTALFGTSQARERRQKRLPISSNTFAPEIDSVLSHEGGSSQKCTPSLFHPSDQTNFIKMQMRQWDHEIEEGKKKAIVKKDLQIALSLKSIGF